MTSRCIPATQSSSPNRASAALSTFPCLFDRHLKLTVLAPALHALPATYLLLSSLSLHSKGQFHLLVAQVKNLVLTFGSFFLLYFNTNLSANSVALTFKISSAADRSTALCLFPTVVSHSCQNYCSNSLTNLPVSTFTLRLIFYKAGKRFSKSVSPLCP